MGGSRGPHTRQQRQWRAQMKGNVQNNLYMCFAFICSFRYLGNLLSYAYIGDRGDDETFYFTNVGGESAVLAGSCPWWRPRSRAPLPLSCSPDKALK